MPSEQEFWLAADRYDQRAYQKFSKAKWIMTEDSMITDPAAYLALIEAQL